MKYCTSGIKIPYLQRGPMTTFMQQLSDMQWKLLAGGFCRTATGWDLHIWSLTVTQFDETTQESWEKLLVLKLAKLRTLNDVQSFCVSNSSFPNFNDALCEGFSRKVRLGGLFSGHRKGMVGPANSVACKLCGSFDDTAHRYRSCPATRDLRQIHGEDFFGVHAELIAFGWTLPSLGRS